MDIEIGKAYIIYGKIPPMKRLKPLSGDHFVTNLILAEIFRPETSEDVSRLQLKIDLLALRGTFELREV